MLFFCHMQFWLLNRENQIPETKETSQAKSLYSAGRIQRERGRDGGLDRIAYDIVLLQLDHRGSPLAFDQ